MNTFQDAGLLPTLLKSLKDMRISKPTEIQSKIIPLMINGGSVVGVSETGSGKTLAYILPLMHILKTLETNNDPVTEKSAPRAIVVIPTRELGEQVSKTFGSLAHGTRLRVRQALGGMEFASVRRNVAAEFEILVATPGRLVQLLDMNLIEMGDVRFLILDEVDLMFDQGFLPDSERMIRSCPPHAQLGMFSATMSQAIDDLRKTLFENAEVVRSAGSGAVVKTLQTKNVLVKDGKRWPYFEKILRQPAEGGTLVFTNTREQCDTLFKELTEKGFECAIYRGEMDKSDRRANYRKFRDGKIDLLVATDVAGRGIDIDSVGRVINYHLPQQMENYLHRVGRTARAGRSGLVINLVTERDEPLMAKLEGRKIRPKKEVRDAISRPQSAPKTGKPSFGKKKSGKPNPFAKKNGKSNPAPKRRK